MHEATGFSPFEMFFGRQVRGPLDLVREQWEGLEHLPVSVAEYLVDLYTKLDSMAEVASELDKKAKEKSKEYDLKARHREFKEGDLVLILNPRGHSKLEAAYVGPFPVRDKVSPVTYRLDVPGHGRNGKIVHVNLSYEGMEYSDRKSSCSVRHP